MVYEENGIDLSRSILRDNQTLIKSFKKNENFQFFLYIIVNLEKLSSFNLDFLGSDYGFSIAYIFRIMINITHLIESWFKKLTDYSGSSLSAIRDMVINYFLAPFNNEIYYPKCSTDDLEVFNEQIENFLTQCLNDQFKLVKNTDVIHYAVFLVITIRNFSHHNYYDEIHILEKFGPFRLRKIFIVAILG